MSHSVSDLWPKNIRQKRLQLSLDISHGIMLTHVCLVYSESQRRHRVNAKFLSPSFLPSLILVVLSRLYSVFLSPLPISASSMQAILFIQREKWINFQHLKRKLLIGKHFSLYNKVILFFLSWPPPLLSQSIVSYTYYCLRLLCCHLTLSFFSILQHLL